MTFWITPKNMHLGDLSGILNNCKSKLKVVITLKASVIVWGSIVKHWQTWKKLMKAQYTGSYDFSDFQIIKDRVRR